jgi:hypothetical protein
MTSPSPASSRSHNHEERTDVKHLSKHLTFANAISCVALFVALSGAAYAATTLGKQAVKTKNLANGSVTALKLRNGAVTNSKLRNGAVTGAKIASATIGSTQLANGAVRSGQLGGGVVTESKLKDGAVTGAKISTNAVTNSKLGPEAVAAGKLAKEAVTGDKLSAVLLGQLVKGVSYATATSLSNEEPKPKSVTALCPAGKQVTGGGARVIGAEAKTVAITESIPALNGENKRNGWTATAAEVGGAPGKSWAVEAFAICAEF